MHEFSFHYPWHNAPVPPSSPAPRRYGFDWNGAAMQTAYRDANREAIARLVVKPDRPPILDPPPDPKPQEVKPHDDPAFRCDRCHCARRRADLRPALEPR